MSALELVVTAVRDLAPGIAGLRRSRHPVDAFRRIHRQPFVEAQLIEQARLAFDQHAETIAHIRCFDRHRCWQCSGRFRISVRKQS